MIPESPQPRIVIQGTGFTADFLAISLAEAGLAVSRESAAREDLIHLNVASIRHRPLIEQSGWSTHNLASYLERHLGEDDAQDTVMNPGDLLVAVGNRTPASPNLIGAGDPTLFVGTGPTESSLISLSPNQSAMQLELTWTTPERSDASLIRLSGEHLDEVGGVASVVQVAGRTRLNLVVPTHRLVDDSIALVDIMWRLKTHPAASTLIPNTPPTQTVSRVVRTAPFEPVDRYARIRLDLTMPIDLASPLLIDAEIAIAEAAADMIIAASTNGRWTAAHFSRIAAPRS